eukprot:GHVT01073170.1.p1 GENE.GHVT01073170.1~~GHVT01073170.1.p1  ORF type:complete len:131 (-),score=22.74 GHVT01073170.1:1011-1403(-)
MVEGAVYIHPSDVVIEGWLRKQSRFLKNWRKRWVVLTKDVLATYKSPDYGHGHPTEYLQLHDCSSVKSAEEEIDRPNAFRVDTANRVFLLLADTTAEKETWIGHIGRQMVRPSVLTHEPEDFMEDRRNNN